MSTTDATYDIQRDIDAALADPVRRARVAQHGSEVDVVLAISALREALGLTQDGLASAAGMSQENLSRIEHATDVKYSTIVRLAAAAGAQLELVAILGDGSRVPLVKTLPRGVTA